MSYSEGNTKALFLENQKYIILRNLPHHLQISRARAPPFTPTRNHITSETREYNNRDTFLFTALRIKRTHPVAS